MRIVNTNDPSYHYLWKTAAVQERSEEHAQIRNSNRGLVQAVTEAAPQQAITLARVSRSIIEVK
jgi:hypothetical protein